MSLDSYKTAIVTGASRGIGAVLVRRLRAKGLTVHAVARSADALDALRRETGCVPHALDVADRRLRKRQAEVEADRQADADGAGPTAA